MSDQPRRGNVMGYTRASTSHQVDSPRVQEDIIRRYAERMGLCAPEAVVIFSDPATSGGTALDERPAGSVMCRRLQKGDAVILAKLDRGFRSLSNFVAVVDTWIAREVAIHICNWPGGVVDTSTPIGRFMLKQLALFAEFERDILRDRIREAMAARRTIGMRTNFKAPFGYFYAPKKQKNPVTGKYTNPLLPNEPEREIARRVVELRSLKLTWEKIVQILAEEGASPPPGLNTICKKTVSRYYEKMKALGMINDDGTPKPGWPDEELALGNRKRKDAS